MAENSIEIPMEYFPQTLLSELNKSKNLPDDFTFYVREDGSKFLERKLGLDPDPDNTFEPVRLTIKLCGKEGIEGRALICLSYGKTLWSITFRSLSNNVKTEGTLKGKSSDSKEWDTGFTPGNERRKNLNSIREICDVVKEELFPHKNENVGEHQGLILVTGATASAKSQITRGLIDDYLKTSIQTEKRRSHLITFEDPIEKYFVELNQKELAAAEKTGQFLHQIAAHDYDIDYTPREKGKGVKELKQALEDALRQTPKVFFVGETRAKEDWTELMKFAGSGHLVVTTAHAGSLVESMQLIFKANEVKSASERNHFANRILGIVHMKRLKIGDITVLLPSIWRRTPKAVNNITATGLTSLIPGTGIKDSTLGRKYFAKKLLEEAKKNLDNSKEKSAFKDMNDDARKKLEDEIMLQALVLDLKGE